jgi:hypothetical protein
MSAPLVTCPECNSAMRGVTLHDADGLRVFSHCDLCGFATVEHLFNSRRRYGASEFAVGSPPVFDGTTGAAVWATAASLSSCS